MRATTRRGSRLLAWTFALVGAVGGMAAPAAAADGLPAGQYFGGTLYLASNDDGTDYPVGASIGWNSWVIALSAPGDLDDRLAAPPGTESVVTFIAPQGHESDPANWNATASWDFLPPGQLLADVTPYHQIDAGPGSPSGTNATAAVSGDYSIGVAYLKDGGQHIVPGGLYFVHIHLTGSSDPDKATYTWEPVPEAGGVPDASTGSSGGGTAAVSADGLLSLEGPAGATQMSVHDGRAAKVAGWTATLGVGSDAYAFASGSYGDTPVGLPGDTPGTVTITIVSG